MNEWKVQLICRCADCRWEEDSSMWHDWYDMSNELLTLDDAIELFREEFLSSEYWENGEVLVRLLNIYTDEIIPAEVFGG